MTGRPVRPVLTHHATAVGAALLAGVAAKIFSDLDEAVNRTVTLSDEPYVADPKRTSLYDDAYGRYRALFDGVEEVLA